MAAGAYKGLTIRIGADTTSLASALRGANSAIFKTQSELNKLNKAAKLDPGNNSVLERQIGAVAGQATAAAAKFDTLSKSMDEMGRQKLEGSDKSIRELAADTNDAALAAENAKDRYNAIDAEIAKTSNSLEELTGIDVSKAIRKSPEAYDKAVEKIRKFASEAKNQDAIQKWSKKNGTSVEETIDHIEKMRKVWGDASRDLNNTQLVESFHNAEVEATAMEAQINAAARSLANLNSESNFSRGDAGMQAIGDRLKVIDAAAESTSSRFQKLSTALSMNPGSLSLMVSQSKALADATEVARAKSNELRKKIAAYKDAGIDKTAKQIGNVALELERSKNAYSDTENKVARLSGELDNAKKRLQALSDQRDSGKMVDGIEDAEREVKRLTQELDEAKRARNKAFDRFDTAKMCSELQEAETEVDQLNAKIREMGKVNLGEVGAATVQAAVEVGNLMRDAGREVIEASSEIDASYRDLRKTLDATDEQYEHLKQAAIDYSQTHVTSADTMLEMEAIAAQVGVTADSIEHFAEVAANLDVATNIDSEEIALQMGQIVNVMDDLREDNVERFGDALVRLGNTMPAQESSIMQITQRLSAVGSTAGFTTPELLGWAAAIASTGQKSEAAATSISKTITRIQKEVSSGGENLELFAKTANMSAEEFSKAWKKDPTEALKAFINGLQDLDEGALQRLEDLDITGVRETQTLLSLAKTVDTVDEAIASSKDAWGDEAAGIASSGDAAAEAEKKAQGFSGTLQKMKNSVQVLASTFGDALVPWMEKATDTVNKLVDYLDSLDSSTKETTVLVGGLFAAFAVAEPIIASLGGNLLKLTRGGLQFAVRGFVGAGKELTRLKDAIALTQGGAGTLGESLVATGTSAGNAITKISSFAKAVGGAATSGNLFLGAFGGLAAVTVFDYARQIAESDSEFARFDSAISDLHGTLDGLSADLWNGQESIAGFGDAWGGASTGMSDFISSLEKHNRANKETRDEAVTTIGELERYGDIIAEAAGKGSDFAGSELELKTAVEGLNEILGTNYDVADILSGVYLDQSGAVENLAQKIDQLVEAKKREVRLSAMEDIYKEDFKAHAEAENAYQKALDARDKFLDDWKSKNLGRTIVDENKNLTVVDESNWEALAKQSEGYRDLNQSVIETTEALNETQEALDVTEKQWQGYADEAAYLETANFGVREGIIMTSEAMTDAIKANTDWGETLEEIQPEVGDLAQKLQEAKVGASEFADMARNNPDVFAEMVQNADGDMDKLVADISEWNKQQLEEKYAIVEWDGESAFITAENERYEWNNGEWKPVNIEVNNYATEALNKASDELRAAIANTDIGVGDLMMGLEGAGVSVEQFASLTADQFSTIATTANGDIDAIVQAIDGLDGVEIRGKEMTFTFDKEGNLTDAEGRLYELTDTGWQVVMDADTSGADSGIAEVESHDGETITENVEANTDGFSEDVQQTKDEAESDPATVPIEGDTAPAEQSSEELKDTVESNPITQEVDVKMKTGEEAPNTTSEQTVTVNAELDDSDASAKLEELVRDRQVNITAVADEESVAAASSAIDSAVSGAGGSIGVSSKVDTRSAVSSIADLNKRIASVPKSTTTKIQANVLNKDRVDALKQAIDKVPKNTTAKLAASVTGKSDVDALINKLIRYDGTTYTVTLKTKYTSEGSKPALPGESATGAYIPPNKIPRHAAGIFTAPTLTNIGWVGEDGAELYSGNSLVPLTNRKYSMPYIDDISDAVARKIGPANGGNQITVTVTGVSSPDEVADAISRRLSILNF